MTRSSDGGQRSPFRWRPVHVRRVRRTAPTLRNAIGFIILLFVGGAAAAQGQQVYQGIQEKLPIEVAPQPVPFSHRQHVAAALACQDCHANAARKERAGLPDAEKCMLCHTTIKTDSPEVQKLVQIHKDGKKLDWVRVYRVPDFVFLQSREPRQRGCGVRNLPRPSRGARSARQGSLNQHDHLHELPRREQSFDNLLPLPRTWSISSEQRTPSERVPPDTALARKERCKRAWRAAPLLLFNHICDDLLIEFFSNIVAADAKTRRESRGPGEIPGFQLFSSAGCHQG